MANNFWNRIRTLFRRPPRPLQGPQPRRVQPKYYMPPPVQLPSSQPMVPLPTAPPEGPLDQATKMNIIYEAMRQNKVLAVTYDGVQRFVEGYSFRDRGSGRQWYGFCSIHGRIHSFKLEKISHIEMTDQKYAPRWEVEIS